MLPGRWMWLQFRVPGDSRAAMPGLTARETALLRENLAGVKPPVFQYSPALEHCMERLLAEHRHPTPESPIAARGVLHELIAWIIRDHRAEQLRRDREPAGYSPPVSKAVEWLALHLSEDISVGDLAAVAGLSPGYFRRWFHREVGSSPRDYVTQLRVERAKRLLAETTRSITDIAFDLGFSTSAYFTAVFHRESGTTPSEYRRRLREPAAAAAAAASAVPEPPPDESNNHPRNPPRPTRRSGLTEES
jgi:AraC-like DNA-binding protein